MSDSNAPVLDLVGLAVRGRRNGEWVEVVKDVDLQVQPGQVVGLVGESGSGKSTTAYAAFGYARPGMRISGGQVRVDDYQVLGLNRRRLRQVRGRHIGLVPQDPGASLTPSIRVGKQIAEVLRVHLMCRSADEARSRTLALLAEAGISDPETIAQRFPHQLSGGQVQRVAIAAALACEPPLLVLDEPTTALDVTTQAKVLRLLAGLRASHGTGMLYVTHDLGVVGQLCDRVAVMFDGQVVEENTTRELFDRPHHPYTRMLISSVQSREPAAGDADPIDVGNRPVAGWRRDDAGGVRMTRPPLLELKAVSCSYASSHRSFGWFWRPRAQEPADAVHDVSFAVPAGSTLGLVGESGSGKTTLARATAGLLTPRSGHIDYQGVTLPGAVEQRTSQQRREIQYVFQNPDASLNPRQRVGAIIGRPLQLFGSLSAAERTRRVAQLLEDVQLEPGHARMFPSQLSGGQRQRVAIARALAAEPKLLLCDEILTALDASVQQHILQLLRDLQHRHGLTYLFISHDLGAVQSLADEVVVLNRGEVMEQGPPAQLFASPQHPYTRLLIDSIPRPDVPLVPDTPNMLGAPSESAPSGANGLSGRRTAK
jgi:peptide/nickel transport system ATP-binding protein